MVGRLQLSLFQALPALSSIQVSTFPYATYDRFLLSPYLGAALACDFVNFTESREPNPSQKPSTAPYTPLGYRATHR